MITPINGTSTWGPYFPAIASEYSFVKVNRELAILFGGSHTLWESLLEETFMYDIPNEQWSVEEATLNVKRKWAASGVIVDSSASNTNSYVIIVGGT